MAEEGKEEEEDSVHRQDITDILTISHLEETECILEIRMEVEWVWDTDKEERSVWECLEVEVHLGMEEMGKCS